MIRFGTFVFENNGKYSKKNEKFPFFGPNVMGHISTAHEPISDFFMLNERTNPCDSNAVKFALRRAHLELEIGRYVKKIQFWPKMN